MSGGNHDDENEFPPFDPNAPAGGSDFDFQVNEAPAEGEGLPPFDPNQAQDFAHGSPEGFDQPPSESFDPPPLDPLADPLADPGAVDFGAPEMAAGEVPPAEDGSTDPLAPVKEAAEQSGAAQVQKTVPAAFPFSVMIDGHLTAAEREKLLDILSRENMGIRELDLEPQFESGRILIPRISEYAAVIIVQSLRNISARMRVGPSDSIFATEETDAAQSPALPAGSTSSSASTDPHPAEAIIVTTAGSLPDYPQLRSIDTITASALLRSDQVAAEGTSEYQELLESLQRELKYKAYRKGAVALLHFKVQLNPLDSPTEFRMMLSALAVAVPPEEPVAPVDPNAAPADPLAPTDPNTAGIDDPLPPWS